MTFSLNNDKPQSASFGRDLESQLESFRVFSTIAHSGAGAIPITDRIVKLTTTDANALTLADGVDGQELIIVMVADGGDGTLTPSSYGNGTTLTFDDVGDSAHLIFLADKWYNVGTPTATVA